LVESDGVDIHDCIGALANKVLQDKGLLKGEVIL
jgi:hypothetical protein